MSLATRKRLTRGTWTTLPIPQWVVSRVEDMAAAECRPSVNVINSVFAEPGDYSNILNEHLDGDYSDSEYSPEDDTSYDAIMDWN